MSTNFLDMSDDDFMNLPQNVETPAEKPEDTAQENDDKSSQTETEGNEEEVEDEPTTSEEANEEADDDDDGKPEDGSDEDGDDDPASDTDGAAEGDEAAKADDDKSDEEPDGKPTGSDDKSKKPDDKDDKAKDDSKDKGKAKAAEDVDYEAAYKKIMAPFKANGREIKLDNPDEVIQLMQRGANYTKKMQALQPSLKILRMLQNNELHDENKINHVIDIMKGDKEAIRHFLKEKGIDPLDFDSESGKQYKPGNHKISDNAMNFVSTLDEIKESEHGNAVIADANTWDDASKNAIFENPQVLSLLADHRQKGYYDRIVGEIEKQRSLGNAEIARLPFLHAYKVVGDAMEQKGLFAPAKADTPKKDTQKPTSVVAKQTAPRKPTKNNGDKAKAASPTQQSNKKAAESINPLAMSDDEFLEQMKNRV